MPHPEGKRTVTIVSAVITQIVPGLGDRVAHAASLTPVGSGCRVAALSLLRSWAPTPATLPEV